MNRGFIQTVEYLDNDQENLLSNLLYQLNRSTLAINNRTIKNKISVNDCKNLSNIKHLIPDLVNEFNSNNLNLIYRTAVS